MSKLSMIGRSDGSTLGGARMYNRNKDAFPLLDFKELSICLQTMEFTASEELISRPTSQYIKTLFEQFVDIFMGLSIQLTEELSKDLLGRNNGFSHDSHPEDEQNNGRFDAKKDDTSQLIPLMILFRCSLAFLEKCGVHDFNIMDLKKPDSQRIRRILSAVINFARFREERMKDCEPIAQVCEELSEDARKVESEIVLVQNEIDKLREQVGENNEGNKKSTLAQLNNYNYKLQAELKNLEKASTQLQLEHAQYKEQKNGLLDQFKDLHWLVEKEALDVEKYKSFMLINASELNTILDDLNKSLEDAEQELRAGEIRLQNRSKTIESIKTTEDELKNILTIVQSIIDDLVRLEEVRTAIDKQLALRDKEITNIEEIETLIRESERFLKNHEEKIQNTNKLASKKREDAKHRLKILEEEYARLTDERGVREKKMDQNRLIIKSLEEDISKMKAAFEREKRDIETAIARLNAHIRSYLSDMNNV